MKIALSSVSVSDQEHALRFYTDILGFQKAKDIPMGDARWLTVTCENFMSQVTRESCFCWYPRFQLRPTLLSLSPLLSIITIHHHRLSTPSSL